MPKFWPVAKKNKKFIIRPMPGPHSKDSAIPLGILMREIFSVARNLKEVKKVLNTGMIELNGKICKDYKMPVGLMDILSLDKDSYRMIPTAKGLRPKKVKDSSIRLAKIKNKTVLGKDKMQLNIDNGFNILVKKDDYKTGDSLLLDNKTGEIKKHMKFDKGSLIVITNGTNISKIGKVEDIHESKNMQPITLTIDVDGEKVLVPKKYVLVISDSTKPVIEMGEDDE